MIKIRNDLLPAGDREKNIPCDLNDTSWFDEIDGTNGAVFFAAGVFYYFRTEDAIRLFDKMAEHFPGGVLVFDACNKRGVKLMLKTWISMPLHAQGRSKGKSFLDGVLSGAVEPVGAVLTIMLAGFLVPAMPYLLSFAAGAMIYVVVEELIPEMSEGEHSNIGVIMFAAGFTLMMALDVGLG